MRAAPLWFLPCVLLACSGSPAATSDVPPADAGDAHDDLSDAPQDTAPHDVIPPYDAGPPPSCGRVTYVRRLATRPAGARALDPGGLVPVTGGYLMGARSVVREVNDAGLPVAVRDSIDLYPFTADGQPRGEPVTVYDGVTPRTDLFTPVLVPTSSGALVLFGESRGLPSATDYTQRIRGASVGPDGRAATTAVVRDRFGEPLAAPLPDGSALVVAARILSAADDAGTILATPTSLHLSPEGAVLAPSDVDLNAFIPSAARSPLLRPAPDGAVLVYRQGVDLHVLRFRPTGALDLHGAYIARTVRPDDLDDAVALEDTTVAVWSEHDGATVTVRAAVLDRAGPARAVLTLETYESATPTAATVVRTHGGAAVLWPRGTGASTTLRVAVVQPDGVLRAMPSDLATTPDVTARVVAHVVGREVVFVGHDATGFLVGGGCLPP